MVIAPFIVSLVTFGLSSLAVASDEHLNLTCSEGGISWSLTQKNSQSPVEFKYENTKKSIQIGFGEAELLRCRTASKLSKFTDGLIFSCKGRTNSQSIRINSSAITVEEIDKNGKTGKDMFIKLSLFIDRQNSGPNTSGENRTLIDTAVFQISSYSCHSNTFPPKSVGLTFPTTQDLDK